MKTDAISTLYLIHLSPRYPINGASKNPKNTRLSKTETFPDRPSTRYRKILECITNAHPSTIIALLGRDNVWKKDKQGTFFPTLVVSKALSDIFFPGLVCSFAVLALVTLHYHISCDVIHTSHEYMKYLTLQDSFYCSCYTRQRPLYNYHNEK